MGLRNHLHGLYEREIRYRLTITPYTHTRARALRKHTWSFSSFFSISSRMVCPMAPDGDSCPLSMRAASVHLEAINRDAFRLSSAGADCARSVEEKNGGFGY